MKKIISILAILTLALFMLACNQDMSADKTENR